MRKNILIKDALGNRVSGTLSIPKGASFVVVMSHGFTSNKNTKLYLKLEKEFNSEGIGTVRYEYYGHGPVYDHEERGVSSDITLTKAAESLRAIIKYLRGKGYQKIGLLGSSFGGLVSLVVASSDKNIKFLALKSPVTNPIKFWNERVNPENTKKWENDDLFHYNREDEDYTLEWIFWKDMQSYDAVKLAKGVSCPAFVVHGDNDKIVPIKYSKAFAKTTGAKLIIVKGADHRYTSPKHHVEMKAAIKDFVVSQTSRNKIKAVIFDWNGVITDSLALDHEIFLKECKRKGLKVPQGVNFYRNVFNDNVFVCLEKIGFHIDDEAERQYRRLYMEGVGGTKPFPGIKPMLKRIKGKYRLAIITSNYKAAVKTFFKNHKIIEFNTILSSDINRRKENKINIFLDKFSLRKEEIIFVGDTISDILACKAVGVKVIGATWGYQSRAALRKSKPDFLADTPQDIIKILQKLEE